MRIQKGSVKSQRFLKKMDENSEYPDSRSSEYIIDCKWQVVISQYNGNKFHVSISTRDGRTLPSLAAITYISRQHLFPYRTRYLLYTAGSNTVHFDIQDDKEGIKYGIEL